MILWRRFVPSLLIFTLSSSAMSAQFVYDAQVNRTLTEKLDLPVFYSVPEHALAPLPHNIPTTDEQLIEYRHPGAPNSRIGVGLRIIKTNRAGLAAKLAKSGLVQTGDVILSFRPEWGGSSIYTNIQLGVSHAGMAYVEAGKVKNLDNPLDTEYLGAMDASHYRDAKMLHIIRPRALSAIEQKNLLFWSKRFVQQAARIYPSQLSFNRDYLDPKYVDGQPSEFVKRLAQIALGQRQTGAALSLYCSEFIWAVLSLKDCSETETFTGSEMPACVREAFKPIPAAGDFIDRRGHDSTPGLADGPLLLADALGLPDAERDALLLSVFEPKGSMTRLSPGHQAIATLLSPFFANFKDYYLGIFSGTQLAQATRAAFNQRLKLNYSPTSYLINTFLPVDHEQRKFDYVGTVLIDQ
jgi:hypothetical protein